MSKPFNPPLSPSEVESSGIAVTNVIPLAVGGQGVVFRALLGGVEVALKIYSPNQVAKRAIREIEKLASLNSPNIVKLIDHGTVSLRGQDCLFTATEFHSESDLSERLKKCPLSEVETCRLLTDISAALDSLWSVGVVHCDLKPNNILLASDGSYRIVDLGMAKYVDPDVSSVTATGIVMGTWGYMAPEQMRSRKNLTIRADLFALGIVAYEAITGHHPFSRDQRLIGRVNPQRPSSFSQISPKLESLIGRLLQIQPYNRPQSGQWVMDHLQRGI